MCAKARLAASEFNKNANISVRRSKNFPGSTLHCHDFYELEIIVDGKTKTVLNGKSYDATGGIVFFLSPSDFHEYSFCDGFELYNIQFTNEAVSSEILERIASASKNVYLPQKKNFEEIVKLVSVMSELGEEKSTSEIQTRILESILLILTKDDKKEKPTALASYGFDKDIQKAVMYIHAHFKENPTLSEVAETIPLNPQYFCTKFREYTGKSYKQYLKQTKLRYARRLVIATELPMLEVAENSGYSSQSHFSAEFREYYGIPPLDMRKKQNHN